MQASSPQVLASAATGIEGFLRGYGLCPDSFLGTLGLAPDSLGAPTRAMDLRLYCRMMEEGARRSGDDGFGLAYGQGFTPQMLGLIGYLALSSPDLMAAARALADYFPLHQQGTETALAETGGLCRLSYRVEPERVQGRRQDALVTMGMFANVFRHAAGPRWCPELVELEQGEHGDRAAIEAAFGAPVRFGATTNALVFRAAEGTTPMPGADPALFGLLLCNLRGLGMEEARPSLKGRALALIRDHLAEPGLDLDFVAERLGTPRWTLQRRLQETGTSFAELLEGERRRMAQRYLAMPGLSISAIAAELGYSEPSAFVRAFRRWEDVTPSAWRKASRH